MDAISRSPSAVERLEWRSPAKVWLAAGGHSTVTNELLVGALHERGVPSELAHPATVADLASPAEIVLARLDVRQTLDGVEDGIWELRRVERLGVRVLNPAPSLMACHDKLQTALRLAAAGIPHPQTSHVGPAGPVRRIEKPVVVKPRFGSWGKDVSLCASHDELERCLRGLGHRRWFQRHGALVQSYVPTSGVDLRVVVAGGKAVGAVQRRAAQHEWRTNVALGATRQPVIPSPEACGLAVAAATAVGGDLVGVDMLPLPDGGYVVLELNGAVEFTSEYSIGDDVFEAVARSLLVRGSELEERATAGL
jgi:RimK family alpha-L-glutamate ligase